MSTRPRPRPRPRPVQKPSTSLSQSEKTATVNKVPEPEDEDERFIRNRGRTEQDWARLLQQEKEKPIVVVDSDEDDEDASPRSKKKQKAKTEKTKGWQNGNVGRFLSQEISSGGEEDVEITGESSQGKSSNAKRPTSPMKRKRSRSKSLTPPPEVSAYAVANAANIVRQALGGGTRARSTSPELDISSDEGGFEDLDPELRKIASQVKARDPSTAPGGAESTIKIRVKLIPHPLAKDNKSQAWVFLMNRSDNFRDLFEETADRASILPDSLVLTYNGARVYPAASPNFLKMTVLEAGLDAYDRKTYDYLAEKRARSVSVFDSDDEEEDAAIQSSPSNSDDESEAGGEKFKLVLRSSKVPKNITLVVKPTTTCQAIVDAFVKKAGITVNSAKARLSVDGDKMDPDSPISEADLEDGDMVEIVGL